LVIASSNPAKISAARLAAERCFPHSNLAVYGEGVWRSGES
jgi:non-canonical (house-cleaning) NTP pyrophosphatase